MEKKIEKILINTLFNILVAGIRGVILSCIGLFCWNYIASVWGLLTLHFVDFLTIYGLIWCLLKTIVTGLERWKD